MNLMDRFAAGLETLGKKANRPSTRASCAWT